MCYSQCVSRRTCHKPRRGPQVALGKRDTQTQVKHLVLSNYLGAWAGIIVNGLAKTAQSQLSQGRPFQVQFLYVDGFSHKGLYLGDTADLLLGASANGSVWGSPVVGIQELDRARAFALKTYGFNLDVRAVLVEERKEHFDDLQESLKLAGFGDRIITNPVKLLPPSGYVTTIQGDFLQSVDKLIAATAIGYNWTFLFLDPWGPTGIPYDVVSRLIALQKTDVMINLPYYDLHKKQGILHRMWEASSDEGLLRNYDALFGTDEWRKRCRTAFASAEDHDRSWRIENELASFYLERLRMADPSLAVKHIRLQFPDRERAMFYLFLTTHDPSGALALNQILAEAELSEYERKWNYQQAKWVHRSNQVGQRTLFEFGLGSEEPPPRVVRTVDAEAVGKHVWNEFRGQQRTKRDVYRFLANSDLFAKDIDRALTSLKKRSLASYGSSPRLDDLITFASGKSP